MLQLRQLSLSRGNKLLLDQCDLQLNMGQKVGLVGRNGCGKSSLFAALQGHVTVDEGDMDVPQPLVSVAQSIPSGSESAKDYVLQGDSQWWHLKHQLQRDDLSHEEHSAYQSQFEDIQGYQTQAKASQLLAGLGFSEDQHHQAVDDFSGGWRMRLALARALLAPAQILLLDEPTNHLDISAVIWLERWLKNYAGLLVVISHDRHLLDEICTHIVHCHQHKLELYTGHYSQFEQQRASRLATQQQAWQKQQREIQHLQQFISRFKAKASKASQAQSRVKRLQKLERIAPAWLDNPFSFQLPQPEHLPDPLLQLEHAVIGYQTPLYQINKLALRGDQRIGLLGLNGAGKTTLIKALAGQLPLLAGERHIAPKTQIGYFAQHQLEQLHLEQSALDHWLTHNPQGTTQQGRDYLGQFNFHGDQATCPIRPFSGGEKARLALALLVSQRPNVLLLDEPTNHLDLDMRQALTMALQQYQGTVVIISHDRWLLDSVCDEFWLLSPQGLQFHPGPLPNDLSQWLAPTKTTTVEAASAHQKKQQRQQQAQQRLKQQPLKKRLQSLERHMQQQQDKLQQLAELLNDQTLYHKDQKSRLVDLLAEQQQIKQQLEDNEANYLQILDQLEQLNF